MFEATATILALAGVILNVYKNKVCFLVWIVSNAMWVIFFLNKEIYSQVLLFSVYICTAIIGYKKWN